VCLRLTNKEATIHLEEVCLKRNFETIASSVGSTCDFISISVVSDNRMTLDTLLFTLLRCVDVM